MIDPRAVQLVAGREISQQIRGKALWISTVITMAAIALLVILPKVLHHGAPSYRIAIAGSPSSEVTAAVDTAVRSAGAHARIRPVADRAAALAALRAGGDAHADIAVDPSGPGSVVVDRALSSDSTDRKAQVVSSIAYTLAIQRAVQTSGLSPDQARALTNPTPLTVDHLRPAQGSGSGRIVALAGSVLFFLLVMRYGFGLLSGVAQEKSTRVVELILATVRPVELLAGKVLGSAVLVLAQAVALVATALISAAAVGSTVLHGTGAGQIVVEGVWVVLGFLLYAALFAAAGAMATKPEDAQSVGLPLQIPLFIGYFASATATGASSPSGLVKVLAYVPFTAPMNMPFLQASGDAGALDVLIAMALTLVTTLLATRVAAAIFRASILRTGQRVRLRALLRERALS